MKKRKDNRYCKQILIGYHPDGRRKLKNIYGKTKIELEKKVFEFRTNIENGIIKEHKKYTFSEFARIWLDTCNTNTAITTQKRYKGILDHHTTYIDDMVLNKIKPIDIQTLFNKLSEENLSSTIKLTRTVISLVMKQAVINGIIQKNPVQEISIPKYKPKSKRALTNAEIETIKNTSLLTDKEKLFLYLGIYAGCRKGESLALTNADFDFKKNLLIINKTLQYPNTNNPVVKNGAKTDAGNRAIPLVEPLKTFAKTYIENNKDTYLFLTREKKLFTKTAYNNMWKQITNKLNMNITSHFLRYTYATILYNADIDIKTTEKIMGHSNIRTTLDIYTSLNLNPKTVINKVNSYLTSCNVL